MRSPKHRAAFVGVGISDVSRFDDLPLGLHAKQASERAIADAGLVIDDIDGVACIPRQPFDTQGPLLEGRELVTAHAMLRYLGLSSVRWGANVDMMLGHSLTEAVNAVESGAANYALVFRALRSSRGGYGHTNAKPVVGEGQFRDSYGRFSPADYAHWWTRYQHVYGTGSREQMATLVVQERENGLRTAWGYWAKYKPVALTREEYLQSRMVSTPFGLYDCDIPVHGCGAYVITTADRAVDLPHPPAYVLGTAAPYFAMHENTITRGHTLERHEECGRIVAHDLWEDSALKASDIDVANLYDGFSFIVMLWLEALGFCGHGESFDFIQDGNIAPGGALPLNPAGGNLGTGRLHGVNHATESVLQVMNRAGVRQAERADRVLFSVGPPARGAALILGREPQE